MNAKTRLLRNAINIALACNLDKDLDGGPCCTAFDLAEEISFKVKKWEVEMAIAKSSNPDEAMDVFRNRRPELFVGE